MVEILMMSGKLATLGPLKIKLFWWIKVYDAIIFTYDVTNKSLTPESVNIVDVVIWLKVEKSGTSMRKVTIASFL